MAKIALITDTHWGVRNDSPVFLDYFKKSIDEFFLPYLEKHNIQHCIHLGDLVDRRKYININTAHRLNTDFLKPLNRTGIKTHIIAGNHDEYYKDTYEVNVLRELVAGKYHNIDIYSVPTNITIDGTDLLLLPWITPDNEEYAINAIKTTKAQICLAHLDLAGFEMYKGMVSDHGTDISLFDGFDRVVTGHYHHRSTHGNITYMGAFTEHIWSDYNDPRGFAILDTETRILDFVDNPFGVFAMVGYDDVKYPDIIDKINSTDYSYLKDRYVRVVCANKTNPYAFDLLLDKLYKEMPVDISIIEDISAFTDNDPDGEIDQAQDTVTILDGYINSLTLPVENDRIRQYMHNVYQEAIALESIE
jgi:DNA repair exonuclease SbcCD nuclease subunit